MEGLQYAVIGGLSYGIALAIIERNLKFGVKMALHMAGAFVFIQWIVGTLFGYWL